MLQGKSSKRRSPKDARLRRTGASRLGPVHFPNQVPLQDKFLLIRCPKHPRVTHTKKLFFHCDSTRTSVLLEDYTSERSAVGEVDCNANTPLGGLQLQQNLFNGSFKKKERPAAQQAPTSNSCLPHPRWDIYNLAGCSAPLRINTALPLPPGCVRSTVIQQGGRQR